MDITGMNKAKVLAALYNAAKPQGLGIFQATPEDMTEVEAVRELTQCELNGSYYFDYLKGRVMKIDLEGDELHTALYNRDNGPEAAEVAIKAAFK